ncbi:hypothetical protein J3R30DRAFT_3418351 [Lentinula aciculospora]|uniref:PBP domain-containing protein n=1 Tax=Lentinula aciculospora TaxID=153920 RepID=A0A9W9DXW0_9AGAR|nr:hypothetical protein J3R30DRAFT_3418351 [Lentinula aciculospora]
MEVIHTPGQDGSQLSYQTYNGIATLSVTSESPLVPTRTYNGGYAEAKDIRLRLANGGAGQSGLIGALADAFVKWCVQGLKGEVQEVAFLVGWYLGDTTQSLAYLSSGWVDVAFTYNEAAEMALLRNGKAVERKLAFVDHFYLVGPPSNPAGLSSEDLVHDIFTKIVANGARDALVPPVSNERLPTRFLSRFDKSATNIKENDLFIGIGQVPWALPPAIWYHVYPQFPHEALKAASVLQEYTLTDRGTWLSSDKKVCDALKVFKGQTDLEASKATILNGSEDDKALLNPCNSLLGTSPLDRDLATKFMKWLISPDGGQKVVREFTTADGQMIYAPAI